MGQCSTTGVAKVMVCAILLWDSAYKETLLLTENSRQQWVSSLAI